MIELIENLQQSPEALRSLVKENLHNESIAEFICASEFLAKVNLSLERMEEVPFFIKHVFRIVRHPQPSEILILNGFLEVSSDENVKKLVQCLLEALEREKVEKLANYLDQLWQAIRKGEHREIKTALQLKTEQRFTPCIELLQFLDTIEEGNDWRNDQYKLKVMKLLNSSLARLSQFLEEAEVYLQILGSFLVKTLQSPLDDFSLLVTLLEAVANHAHFVRSIIKNWQIHTPTQIPSHVLSCALFKYFTYQFDHQSYFKQSPTDAAELFSLCEEIYDLIKTDFSFDELGWISIFSISKWIHQDIPENLLYNCVAFIRQNFFERIDIISEILVLNASKSFNEVQFKFSQNYQFLLSTLTPKQMKYLIFKLDQILPAEIKQAIIAASIHENAECLGVIALYFSHSATLSQQGAEDARQMRAKQEERWSDVTEDIKRSRYNSLQKQITFFRQRCKLMFCDQLGCLKLKPDVGAASIFAFFKDLFLKDYFSEEFWICEQKMWTLIETNEKFEEKVDVIFDFLQYEKIENLSGVMILTELLREGIVLGFKYNQKQFDLLSAYLQLCFKIVKNEVFISNISIILNFVHLVSELPLPLPLIALTLDSFHDWRAPKALTYSKLSYSIEAIILNLLEKSGNLLKLRDFSEHLTYYVMKEEFLEGPREYCLKAARLYHRLNIKFDKNRFHNNQLLAYHDARKLILSQTQPQSLKASIAKISEVFEFHSPLYNGEIVFLTHLARSPEESYYFRNHFVPFVYHQYAKIYALAAERLNDPLINDSIFTTALDLLHQILKGDTFSHGIAFYKSLNKSQLLYSLLSNTNLQYFTQQQLEQIIEVCLMIVEKDNYPLLRQYISVVLCRAYLIVVERAPEGSMRKQLIEMMRVNINIGVPLALILGYELIKACKSPPKYEDIACEIMSIHELLVKFISCHTAYLRGICQYYLYLYLDLVDPKDQFLTNLKLFWNEDKDSQKILTNISMVVQGFKEAVENQCDFVGFERVEEFPTNQVKMEFYGATAKFYSEFVLNEFLSEDFVSSSIFDAMNQAAADRYEELKSNYLLELENFISNEAERTVKSNVKKAKEKEKKIETVKKEKPKKQENKNKKGKKEKNAVAPKEHLNNELQLKDLPKFKLDIKYRLLEAKLSLSKWCRSSQDPQIIVIATLLEKVHNFGHILRTLHGKQAMLVVPSVQPLLHPECKQLVPPDCDVQIVEIRHRDLQKFITLMKALGYPLVALEQCSRSVMVEQATFPDRFMMLLGNERIGAPSALLNEGDLLVEIPQIGKIRSLNVHVSMVICLWEFLLKAQ